MVGLDAPKPNARGERVRLRKRKRCSVKRESPGFSHGERQVDMVFRPTAQAKGPVAVQLCRAVNRLRAVFLHGEANHPALRRSRRRRYFSNSTDAVSGCEEADLELPLTIWSSDRTVGCICVVVCCGEEPATLLQKANHEDFRHMIEGLRNVQMLVVVPLLI